MRGKIYKLSEKENECASGELLGIIVIVGGNAVLRSENKEINEIIEPILNQELKVMDGTTEGDRFVSGFRTVKPGDKDYLLHLRYKLLEYGLWLEIEE